MKNPAKILLLLLLCAFSACTEKLPAPAMALESVKKDPLKKALQDSIINEHLKKGAYQYHIYSQDWQREIDKGLAKDSTIAYLWQQKAMPLFKQGKYEAGMEFIDKAVKYNPQRWQDYRAFIKCIFAKRYRDAITDF